MPAAITSAGERPVIDAPVEQRPRPCAARSSPLITRSTVDLPAPLGPTMQVIEPRGDGQVDALQDVAAAVAGDDRPRSSIIASPRSGASATKSSPR